MKKTTIEVPKWLAKDINRVAEFCEMSPAELVKLLLSPVDPESGDLGNLRGNVPYHVYKSRSKALAAGLRVWGKWSFAIERVKGGYRIEEDDLAEEGAELISAR